MDISLSLEERRGIIARAIEGTTAASPDTIERASAELATQYRLELAAYVPGSAKRAAVAHLIDSALPQDTQDQISDRTVTMVFADLVRNGFVEFEVEWTIPPPPVIPEPLPQPEPLPPIDPSKLWIEPPPPPQLNLEDLWPPPISQPPKPRF